MRAIILAALCAASALAYQSIRLAIVSDIHLDPTYDEKCGFPLCMDRGRKGSKGSPPALLEAMLNDMRDTFHDETLNGTKIDAIILTGDLLLNSLSSTNYSQSNWEQQKTYFKLVIDTFAQRFPNTPLIVSLGDADSMYY